MVLGEKTTTLLSS